MIPKVATASRDGAANLTANASAAARSLAGMPFLGNRSRLRVQFHPFRLLACQRYSEESRQQPPEQALRPA